MVEVANIEPVGQETPYSCGVGALETIFKFFGREIGGNLKYIDESGTGHDDIEKIAEKNGFEVEPFIGSVGDLERHVSSGIPVLVNYQDYGENNGENGHYAVVIGVGDGKIKLADPAEGGKIKEMDADEFEKRWNDGEAPEGEQNNWAAVVFPSKEELEAKRFNNYVKGRGL